MPVVRLPDFPPNVASPLGVRRVLAPLVLLVLTVAAPVWAANIRALEVDEHQGRYTVTFDALLDAPYERIYAAITNPAQWPRLSPVVTAAEVLAKLSDDRRKVSVTFRDCILIFCQTVHKNEILRTSAGGNVDALAIPEQSDFSYAHEHWRISGEGRRTRIQYRAEMTPNFYVPPLIGAYILKAKIRSLLLRVTANLEALTGPHATADNAAP
jgi:Polyketide cyclase / dehydrase and lipid transport